MNKLAVYLNQHIDGVAYDSADILERYSKDRSLLQYKPRIVAVPSNVADVSRLVKFSNQLAVKGMKLPITVRGAGLSKTGTSIGGGILMVMEKLNRIQELDVRQRLIRVQCGATLGEVKKALSTQALDLPIVGDPRETIGDLIGRCAAASVNTKPGTIVDFIQDMEVVLSDGSIVTLNRKTKAKVDKKTTLKTLEGKIYKNIDELLSKNKTLVSKLDPQSMSRAWYSGVKHIKEKGFNLVPVVCGSEGTLAIATEVILTVEPIFEEPNYFAIACDSATQFVRVLRLLKELKFTDIEFYDTKIFAELESTGKTTKFYRKAPDNGFLIVANAKDDSRVTRKRKLSSLKRKLPQKARLIIADKDNFADFAKLDESLQGYLNFVTKGYRAPVIDNVYIPEKHQGSFIAGVNAIADKLSTPLAIFGLGDYDLFTVRPTIRPDNITGYKKMIDFLRDYLHLVDSCDGYACGAAPEGRLLAPFLKASENPSTIEFAKQVKAIFDPQEVLNPDIKQNADPRVIFKHFRSEYTQDLGSKY